MLEIESVYNELVCIPSDINEHLPVLKKCAEESETITEFGVRGVVSTVALITGKPKKMLSVDLFHPSRWGRGAELDQIVNYAIQNNIDYKFLENDTRTIEIDNTDLLFIDTLHTYEQLKVELKKHGNKAQKFLIFHDTTLYAYVDEHNSYTNEIIVGDKKGLWPAIEEFLFENPHWSILQRYNNNNGLTILQRKHQ